MRKLPSNISISLSAEVSALDIAISCYQSYKALDKEKLSYDLMRLASKGYKKGANLLDILVRGFAEDYRKEFIKKNLPSKVYDELKEGLEILLDVPSLELETNKVKLKVPYPALNIFGVIASKLKLPKWGKEKKEEPITIDGQEFLKINKEMQQAFAIALNSYFTKLVKEDLVPIVLNSEKEISEFHDRYLVLLNELDEATNLQFVKWLFPGNDKLWDQIYNKT